MKYGDVGRIVPVLRFAHFTGCKLLDRLYHVVPVLNFAMRILKYFVLLHPVVNHRRTVGLGRPFDFSTDAPLGLFEDMAQHLSIDNCTSEFSSNVFHFFLLYCSIQGGLFEYTQGGNEYYQPVYCGRTLCATVLDTGRTSVLVVLQISRVSSHSTFLVDPLVREIGVKYLGAFQHGDSLKPL
jgi:hypothetical protein